MSWPFADLREAKQMPVVLTNPCACCRIERKDIPQNRWRREIALCRLQPADKIREIALFAASAAIKCVDDARQVDIEYRSYHPLLLRRREALCAAPSV